MIENYIIDSAVDEDEFNSVEEDELDKELVKFFYNSGLYLRYAKELLPESSIDEVTVDFSTL